MGFAGIQVVQHDRFISQQMNDFVMDWIAITEGFVDEHPIDWPSQTTAEHIKNSSLIDQLIDLIAHTVINQSQTSGGM